MGSRARILVLLSSADASRSLAAKMNAAGGVEVDSASDLGEAIRLLRDEPFDMLMAGSGLTRPSAVAILTKARETLPRVLRVFYEETAYSGDLRSLINEACPCAILSGRPDTTRLISAVQAHRALQEPRPRHSAGPAWLQAGARPGASTSAAKPAAPNGTPTGKPHKVPVPKPLPAPAVAAASAATGAHVATEPALPDLDGQALVLASQLEALLEQPELHLPSLPCIAVEVQKLINQDFTSYEQIADKVGLDPAMSARMLEVANSPLYAAAEPARSLQSAMSRIGLRETRNVLQAVMAEKMFASAGGWCGDLLNRLWLHSLAVAYGNELMARTLEIPESQEFFMMGLLHDIGKLLILCLLGHSLSEGTLDHGEIPNETIQALFAARHGDLGHRLMQKWGFPDTYCRVAALHNDDTRVCQYEEGVVVTYYSNLLTRRVDLSLRPHDPTLFENRRIAQALNITPEFSDEIAESMIELVDKVKQSYLPT